nr:MAG TPA: hypothetical protein [Caudoviricetes sp.]
MREYRPVITGRAVGARAKGFESSPSGENIGHGAR